MKKILFISNVSKRISNFSTSSIIAGQSLGYEFHMAANYTGFVDDASKHNVMIHHIDLDRNPFSLKNIRAYKQMIILMKEKKFSMIHCNTPIGGILGRLCGKRANVPKIIYTAHGFHFHKGAPIINRTLFKWAEMWMAHYTDAIITINQEDYQSVQKFKLRKGGKVYYIPGVGIDTSAINQADSKREELLQNIGADSDSVLLISTGELSKRKNNQVVIRALGKLKNPKIHFILCGVGDEMEELISLARDNNVITNVHFLGYCTDVPQLLKSSDIFIMPSYREGLARSLMEAMAAGLPCVVSKIRGNVDLIIEGEGGYLRQPDDIDGFVEVIDMISTDASLREAMGINNRRKIAKFDIDNVNLEMKRIYSDILGES